MMLVSAENPRTMHDGPSCWLRSRRILLCVVFQNSHQTTVTTTNREEKKANSFSCGYALRASYENFGLQPLPVIPLHTNLEVVFLCRMPTPQLNFNRLPFFHTYNETVTWREKESIKEMMMMMSPSGSIKTMLMIMTMTLCW